MTILDSAQARGASVTDPKRLYRLAEPAYADLEAGDVAAFYANALSRTLERFGAECGIEEGWLGRREGMSWQGFGSGEETLRQLAEGLEPAEWEVLRRNRILFSPTPFRWRPGSSSPEGNG